MSNTPEAASARQAAGPSPVVAGAVAAGGSGSGAVFDAVLMPHRSLGPRGFLLLMGAIGLVSFGTGLVFLLLGAWPVMAFCGLDVALIWLAFMLNYRAARLRETVRLTAGVLEVRRLHPSGQEQSWRFNPYWVRLALEDNQHTERADLKLRSHGRELIVGHFLSEPEKLEFAKALGDALATARSGAAG